MIPKTTYIIINLDETKNKKEKKYFYKKILKRNIFLINKNRKKKNILYYNVLNKPDEDIEKIKKSLNNYLNTYVLLFNLYNINTHSAFISSVLNLSTNFYILPTFPQYNSFLISKIASFFSNNLPKEKRDSFFWIKSFPCFTNYIESYQDKIKAIIKNNNIQEENLILLFSSISFSSKKDSLFELECKISITHILKKFPLALAKLAYQEGFYNQEKIYPTTLSICENISEEKRKDIIIIPFSLIINDYHAIYEIEQIYIPILKKKNYNAILCPSISNEKKWLNKLHRIFETNNFIKNEMLIKK